MSGLDPLAALAAQSIASAQAAMEEAALNLGALTETLQAQLSIGDILTATVLPPENGSDRIALLGQTFPAQLPAGIDPGQALQLQVTGFSNTAIIVRNLGLVDPQNPPPPIEIVTTPQAPPGAQTVVPTAAPAAPPASPASAVSPAPSASAAPPVESASPPTPPTPLAPPREIFVAASVVSNAAAPNLNSSAEIASDVGAPLHEAEVEARIALNRATTAAPPLRAIRPAHVSLAGRTAIPPAVARGNGTTAATAAPATRSAPTPEFALLTRLRIPVSTTLLTAARGASTAAQAVTTKFERLDAVLAKLAPDPRVGSLRSMLAFVGKLDVRNVRTLPEQIAAFVSHVVDGAESKLAQVVRVLSEIPQAQPPAPPSVQENPAPAHAPDDHPIAAAAAQERSAQNPPAAPVVNPNLAARAAERIAALDHDVKSAILALVQTPPRDSTPAVAQALRNALIATTSLQLNVLSAQSTDPNVIAIPLPAYFYDGGKPAELRISRDAPGSARAMDADNFHIAFVLDTKSLGTVAIDVQTVGRAVSVDVKTQASTFADRFRSTLGDLRGRLESLRYRVASIGAGVAQASNAAPRVPERPREPERRSNLDMRA